MDVADTIAVLNGGRLEQVGPPRDLYDAPASAFVMGFLGPVSRLGDALVRPHDVSLLQDPEAGAIEAMVTRIVHLGFEVRAELVLPDGEPVRVQLTRHEAEQLEVAPGDVLWLRPPAGAALSRAAA